MPGDSYIDVPAAIKRAEQLKVERKQVIEREAIVRGDLRNAVKLGGTTPDQARKIAELYPEREQKADTKPASKAA